MNTKNNYSYLEKPLQLKALIFWDLVDFITAQIIYNTISKIKY